MRGTIHGRTTPALFLARRRIFRKTNKETNLLISCSDEGQTLETSALKHVNYHVAVTKPAAGFNSQFKLYY